MTVRDIKNYFINHVWYHLWYKHTKKHKQELEEVENRVLEIRRQAIGR